MEVRELVKDHLIKLHKSPEGLALLGLGQVQKFVPVGDEFYNPIRRTDEIASRFDF